MSKRSSPPDPAPIGDDLLVSASAGAHAYIQISVHESGRIELKGTPGDVRQVVERLRREGFPIRFDCCSWCG